jgi:hypothetical protein
MPSVEFETATPAFERAKMVHALDRADTVIGNKALCHEEIGENGWIAPSFLSGWEWSSSPIPFLLYSQGKNPPVPIWVGDYAIFRPCRKGNPHFLGLPAQRVSLYRLSRSGSNIHTTQEFINFAKQRSYISCEYAYTYCGCLRLPIVSMCPLCSKSYDWARLRYNASNLDSVGGGSNFSRDTDYPGCRSFSLSPDKLLPSISSLYSFITLPFHAK